MHVVATAGHVDHGKSTLVEALTGTDPDRFAEEKARGLTIDLGFATTTLPSGAALSLVDVPGHVRFIKNMLAGVGAVDACLFVVAATEGWKPQSEEHLRILELLGVRHGVVALTKVGPADDDLVDLAHLEVEERVAGTFLEGAPVVNTDAPTGVGLDNLRAALDDLLADLCLQGEAERDEVLEMVLVGNPIMHHLFLGLDPTPLGQAPFTLAVENALDVPAADLNLEAHACTRVHVLPCIAGHVGADTAAVVLASRPHTADDVRLVVDVGTNAEIVLAGNGRILAASSPTGPAFEGAQVSAGQRATPGAIERIRIDPDTGEPRFRVIGAEPWSDEPGFDEAVADTGVTGICGSGIIEVVAELWLAGLMNADGVIGGPGTRPSRRLVADGRTLSYVLHDPDGGGDDSGILVTQNDVRAIQLAKAALYAGIRLLMDHLEVDEVDQISLAGAFGSHIDTVRATVLGLVPDCEPDRVASIGNAAGAGAVIALLSAGARTEIQEVVDRIEKIETALEPSFQAHFVDAMAIPHRTADYPRLSTCITLPQRPAISTTGPERSGRRRRRAATGEE